MASSSLVPGDNGCISSDSSFYGSNPPSPLPRSKLDLSVNLTTLALKSISAPKPPEPWNPYADDILAYQLGESLSSFLKRLPPSKTSSADGPWIRIAYPLLPRRPSPDLAKLMQVGTAMLSDFSSHRASIEASMAGKTRAAATRKLNELREVLTQGLLSLAQEVGETTGKWMLFPTASQLDRWWKVIAEGTLEGRLGCAAKVATKWNNGGSSEAESEKGRLICVYTADFEDRKDVRRVLEGLLDAGLVDERGIWYKCDAWTHLGIDSKNEWGIRASLYGSREVAAWDLLNDIVAVEGSIALFSLIRWWIEARYTDNPEDGLAVPTHEE